MTPARILIVDDEPGLLRLVGSVLEREGFTTATVRSGTEAIGWLSRDRADLMLLDLGLRDIDGPEVLHRLANTGHSVPFIIMTGHGDERVAVEMMKSGALDYLVKDLKFIEFVPTMVRRALEKLEAERCLADTLAGLEQSQRQLLTISECERRRLGAELHDGLGQQLTAIELMCQALKEDLPSDRPDLQKEISQIGRFLREAIAQTRSLAHRLSPMEVDSSGLVKALGDLALRMTRDGGIQCRLLCPSAVLVQDPVVAGHLFRIAQEGVNNAVKHSEASEVLIRLERGNDGTVCLSIADNGRGLPPTSSQGHGIGLQLMKYRATVIGARLSVESSLGNGVTIQCTLSTTKP